MQISYEHPDEFHRMIDGVHPNAAADLRARLRILADSGPITAGANPLPDAPALLELVVPTDEVVFGLIFCRTRGGLRAIGYWRRPATAGLARVDAIDNATSRFDDQEPPP